MGFQDEMKQMFLRVAAGEIEPKEWEKWWNSNKARLEENLTCGDRGRMMMPALWSANYYWMAKTDFFCRCNFSSHRNSIHYLTGAPFAFVKPEFGYLSTMFDTELWEEASCPKGHMETYIIRRKGITDSGNRSVWVQEASWDEVQRLTDKMPARQPNPWTGLLPVIGGFEDCQEKHMAKAVCRKGISRETPFPVAVFLYLYLLQNMGMAGEDAGFSQLCRRMFDRIFCPACGAHFAFIDGWQHPFGAEV